MAPPNLSALPLKVFSNSGTLSMPGPPSFRSAVSIFFYQNNANVSFLKKAGPYF